MKSIIRARQVCIDGVEYKSVTEAFEALGVSRQLINHRCKSPNFPTWEFRSEATNIARPVKGTIYVIRGTKYAKRYVAALAEGYSTRYIGVMCDDPGRPDCYRLLPDGTKVKNVEAHLLRQKLDLARKQGSVHDYRVQHQPSQAQL